MPAGRPTLLTDAALAQAKAYVAGDWEKLGHIIPSNQGLAVVLNVDESTIYDWGKLEDSEFPKILGQIKAKQHFTLINKGLNKELSDKICALVLGKHGYAQAVKADHTINDYASMDPEERKRKLMELQQALKDADSGRS